jgi:D-ribose pyranase
MKKHGILNRSLSEAVAAVGHTDMLVVADAGLPIPDDVWRIDLALTAGVPSFLETVEVILEELEVQEVIIAEEMLEKSPDVYQQLQKLLGEISVTSIPHEDLKCKTSGSKAIVRTGEFTPYANVILVSGVVF